MSGKIIVVDGLDGSGKSTQTEKVFQNLKKKYDKVILISYPDYESPSSALVRMYLNGEFSNNPNDVNAYASSSFYAVDRYASFMKEWKSKYEDGYIIIASRYVSSNAIHQMVKLDESEWDNYLSWLDDFEFNKLGLPRADKVIFLKMSRNVADKLIMSRYDNDESKKDIHENNMEYLVKCMKSAEYTAKKQNWSIVNCCDGKNAYSIEDISNNIMKEIQEVLGLEE